MKKDKDPEKILVNDISFLEQASNPNPEFYPYLVKEDTKPIPITPVRPPEIDSPKPEWRETVGAGFRSYNAPYRAIKYLSQFGNPLNKWADDNSATRQEGYDPVKEGLLDTIPEEYHMDILLQSNRADAMTVINNINQLLEDQQTMERSGTLLNLGTGLVSGLLDPTILIPMTQTIKYASLSKNIYAGMINTAKVMGPAIALENAILTGTKETEDLTDWAYNTLVESFFAASLGGIGGAFVGAGVKGEMKAVRGAFAAIKDDVEIRYKIGQDGEFIGPMAVGQGGSVGAMKAKLVQEQLDAGTVTFKNNPFIKKVFGWGSPLIEGLTSRFPVVQKITDDLFPNVFEVAGGVVNYIKGPSAYDFVKLWKNYQADASRNTHGLWVQSVKRGNNMSYNEFKDNVAFARRRGNKADIPEVSEAASYYSAKLFDPLLNEIKKQYPDFKPHEFTNMEQHLSRIYDKDKILRDPEGFKLAVTNYLGDVTNRINARQAPISETKVRIQQSKENIASLKNRITKPQAKRYVEASDRISEIDAEIKNYTEKFGTNAPPAWFKERATLEDSIKSLELNAEETKAIQAQLEDAEAILRLEETTLSAFEKQLQQAIADGDIDLDMLTGKPDLTGAQIKQIEEINAPIVEAERQLVEARTELQELGTLKNLKQTLTTDLQGIASGAISEVASSVEKFGVNKTLRAVKKWRSAIVANEKRVATEGRVINSKIDAERATIKDLTQQKREKKELLKSLERKLIETPSKEKKTIRSLKTEIANEKNNLAAIPGLIDESRTRIKPLQTELNGMKESKPLFDIAKESANEAFPFIEKAIKNLSEKELLQQISTIEKGVRKISREGLAQGKAKRNAVRRKIKEAKENIKSAKEKFLNDVDAGKIPEELYYQTSRGAKLLDPNAQPTLRGALDEQGIYEATESIFNNVTQLNPEQVAGAIWGGVKAGGNDPFKSRVLLWNDSIAEPWLVNDIDAIAGIYSDQISKRLYLDKVLANYGSTSKEGMDGIVRELLDQRKLEEKRILRQPESPAREAELAKLKKDYDKNEKFLGNLYKTYMGNYVDKSTTAYRVTDSIKKFAVATMLGNVPLLQFVEFVAPLFRANFKEWVFDGLTPALDKMKKLAEARTKAWGDKANPYIRGSYADFGVACDRYIGNQIQQLTGYGTQYQPRSRVERGVSNLAVWSQNISGANFISDMEDSILSSMYESNLIRSLKRFRDGEELTKFEIDRLDRSRLNPAEWSDRILKQFDKHGKDVDGAFNPNFHLWDDVDAARSFGIAVEKNVRQSRLKPGPLDQPFGFKDPYASMLFQFTSYVFAATNNFAIPLLTNPDMQKVIGTICMMAAGSLVDPMRQLSKGQEVDTSLEALSASALGNSGIMGWQFDALIRLMANLPVVSEYVPDRAKSRALSIGPASGLYGMAASVLGAAASNELNKADLNRLGKLLIPFYGVWYAQQPINKALEALAPNLPENRAAARRQKEE